MPNPYFQFKQFTIQQDRCAMKVTTDACLFGAWVASKVGRHKLADCDKRVMNILDIGTGSGLLALMLAQQGEYAIDAIEIDKDAFEQASENMAASPWPGRVKVFHADVKEFAAATKYDVIICNPPFYENELKGVHTKKNIAHHDDGLLIPELLNTIKRNLEPDGSFYLLLPFKRNEEIKKLLTENNYSIREMTFIRQSTRHDYFRILLAGKLKTDDLTEIMIDEISIKNDPSSGLKEQYTPAFINLLKEYYLHL